MAIKRDARNERYTSSENFSSARKIASDSKKGMRNEFYHGKNLDEIARKILNYVSRDGSQITNRTHDYLGQTTISGYDVLGTARGLMDEAINEGDLGKALTSVELYSTIGKSDKPHVENKLMLAYSKAIEKGNKPTKHQKENLKYFLTNSTLIPSDSEFGQRLGLEKTVSAVAGVVGLVAGLFFLSSNLTGNVIGNLSLRSSNLLGLSLFLIGLIGAFFYFKKK